MFAVGSMNAKYDRSLLQSYPYVYKINGEIYHTLNIALYPDENNYPEYAQLYIIDTGEATEHRMNIDANENCDLELAILIEEMLKEINPYYDSFQMMHEVYSDEFYKAELEGTKMPEIRLLFDVNANADQRRFNIPRSNEIAAVFVLNDNDELPPNEG